MTLTPAEIASLSRLLDQALDLDVAQREAWLAALPPEDQPHVGRLRKMLVERASGKGDDRLASLPHLSADAEVAHAGDTVGPYRLLHEIGHGGMGSVWLAERADGRFERQVALKLPRLAWGAGLAERMAREREIGMLLEHASIARLYDAGVDERGRPYLAMEYIDGQPLDAWCAARALDIPARLRLFLQIARAVAYAHGRLVVHRDLKPSNVLVSADGQVHLLDFGIAKRLTEAAPGAKGLTQEQGRVLTPHYASPEQIAGEAITVASDVHSLGVLLYEMLTGALPIAPRRDTPGAVEDAILQGDAPLASSRAKNKATVRTLRGELDAILGKAMQREPQRRYATADALAQDIERYLKGETVAARPDSVAYRMRKAVRRHWVGVSAAAAVLVAVLAGSGVSLIQAQRASDAAERARIVKDFVVDVFRVNARDDPAKNELRQLPAEQLLEHGAQLIDMRFAGQPMLQAELYGVVGGILLDMSSAKLAEEYARKQIAAQAMTSASLTERVDAQLLLAQSLGMMGRLTEAKSVIGQAMSLRGIDGSLRIRLQLELARVLLSEAEDAASDQQLQQVEGALVADRTLPASLHAEVAALRATWLTRRNQFDDAIKKHEQAIESATTANGAQSREVANIRLEFSRQLAVHDHGEAAITQLQLGVDALRKLGGPDDVRAALTEADIAMRLSQDYAITLEDARARIERARASLAMRPNLPKSILARPEFNLGAALWWRGNIEEGYDHMSLAAAELLPYVEGTDLHFDVAWNLGQAAEYLGQGGQAEKHLRDAVSLAMRLSGPNGVYAARAHRQLAHFLRTVGRYSEAEAVLSTMPPLRLPPGQTALQALRTEQIIEETARIALDRGDTEGALRILPKEDKFDVAVALHDYQLIRGEALCAKGRREEGLLCLERFLEGVAKAWDKYDPDIARTRAVAGLCALADGQRVRATEFASLAREAFVKQPRIGAYWQGPSRRLDSLLKVDAVAKPK